MNESSSANNTNIAINGSKNPTGMAAWICLGIAWLMFLLPIPGTGMFIGWPLNLVAFVLAIVSMSKLGTNAGLWQLLASLIASPIVYFIGVMIMSVLFAAADAVSHSGVLDTQVLEGVCFISGEFVEFQPLLESRS